MIELLVLIAIAYAGARGVESITNTSDRRQDTKAAEKTLAGLAAGGPTGGSTGKKPGPADPGGTFSAAAPRSAKAGGKAAVPLAVITETGSTMWKAVGEGYRERWPEIREERRQKMAERAARRTAEKKADEAKKKADEVLATAGPPPAHPPKPADPPKTGEAEPPATVPAPRDPEKERADVAEAAEKKAEAARKDAEEAKDQAAKDKILAAQKETREAKDRADAAEQRQPTVYGWPGDGTAYGERHPAPADEPPTGRRHLAVVPKSPAQNGETVSAPQSIIPEIRTLDGLMNALTIVKAMCEMRSEEALAIAADDLELSNRLDRLETELAEMEVDAKTTGEINELRESIHAQSKAAAQYGGAAKDAGDFAVAAAQSAYKAHGGIAEAVQSSPIEKAAQGGYYNQ